MPFWFARQVHTCTHMKLATHQRPHPRRCEVAIAHIFLEKVILESTGRSVNDSRSEDAPGP